jgi:hypothetical protein
MELLPIPSRKTALAFGLKWVAVDPFEKHHEQVARWREEGYRESAVYWVSGEAVHGLLKEGFDEQHKQQVRGLQVLAAAACAATFPRLAGKSVLVAIELPGSEGDSPMIATIGIIQGVVVLDQICDGISQLSEARQSFVQKLKGKSYEVYGNAGQVHHELELESLIPLSGLFTRVPAIRPLRARRGYKPAIAVAVLGLLSALGLYAWDSHKSEIQRRTKLEILERNKPDYQYRQSVQALLQKPVVPLAGAIEAIRVALADLPLVHAGWELTRIACAPTGDCAVRFKRLLNTGASLDGFRKTAGLHWQGITAAGQDEIAFTLRIRLPQARLRRHYWPASIEFRDRGYASWQFLEPGGWRAEFGPVAIQAVPATVQPKDLNAMYAVPEAVFAMPVVITNQPWWYANPDSDSPVRHELLGDNTVMDGDIELTHSNKLVTFSAKGLSYVQR